MDLTIEQALQKAVEAHKAGQIREADRLYTAILKAQPKHPDANHNLGVLAVSVGKAREALPFFKAALEANPSIAQFWLSYIDALIKLEKLEDAKSVLNQAKGKGAKGDGFDKLERRLQKANQPSLETNQIATEPQPKQPNILDSLKIDQALKLAKKKEKAGLTIEAKSIYRDILTKFPKNTKAVERLKALQTKKSMGASYVEDPPQDQVQSLIDQYNKAQLQQALQQADFLLQKFPKSALLYNIQGAVLKGLGQLDSSIEAYKKALDIKPDYAEAYYNIGVSLREQGTLEEAINAYKKALDIKPDYADAYYNMGIALKEQGRLEEAINAYKKALDIKPDYADAYNNMGVSLQEQGRLEEAINTYKNALAIKPDYAEAYYNLGISLREQGTLEEAINAYKDALAIKPDYADAYNNMGNALKEQCRLEEAINAYKNALAIKPDYADAYNNMGNALKEQGRLEEAINAYKNALAIKPDYADAYNNMGNALKEQGRLEEAINTYKNALAIKPNHFDAYNNMGVSLQEQGRLEEAINAYKNALAIKPDYADAWSNGADALEKWNKLKQLGLWLEEAFKILQPVSSDLRFFAAKLLWRKKDKQEAFKLISNIDFKTITPIRKREYLYLKAKCFEASSDYDLAYESFNYMNSIAVKSNDYLRLDPESYFQNIRQQLASLKSETLENPVNDIKEQSDFVPVFLVGFPRSGTTLLDTILRSHSCINVLEEQPLVSSAKAYVQKNGYPEMVQTIPQSILSGARIAYITELDKNIRPQDKKSIVIDKLPLNLLEIPLIHQLYPQARYILALRHPLDTILSCWMQNFKLNVAMANMVNLDHIVEFYSVAMETFTICRTKYNLSVHEIRYEDLLENLIGETSRLLKFLDLDWEAQMKNYQETALNRGHIRTPSYSQVVQPIYVDAKYRWLNYEKYLTQYIKQVEPWVNEFGYSKHCTVQAPSSTKILI